MTTLSSQSRRSINNNNNNSTSTQMPKLLHAFCCCLRPNPLNEKNDCRSTSNINNNNNNNNIYDSSNNRNILQSSKNGSSSQPINKTTQQLAGDLRQRLNPSTKKENKKYGFNFNNIIGNGSKSQLQQQQQKRMATQITVDGSTCNNNLISSNNNCSTNNTSNICIDGPFIGNENQKDLQNSTSNWSSQNLQQQNNSTCSSSPRVQQQQLPLAVAPLLSNPLHRDKHKKCLILDLDETLVHSSFKPVKNADFVIPIEIDNVVHQVYVLKRPHTDHFLERVGSLFECVLFTASLSKYADPVADLLDRKQVFRFRLFREACVFFEGNYVKDLEKLGRDLRKVIIIDNSPASYAFHPNNSLPIRTWFDDPNDTELLDLLPILEELSRVEDIYSLIGTFPPSSINLQQQQQRYQQQQQQRRLQQYSSPYYSTSTSSMMSSGGPSSIITQATMPSDVNNNNQLFSSLSITNEDDVLNDQLKQQQPKQKFSSSSSIYIQMGNDENNNKKKEDERLRRRNLSSTSNGSTSVTSPIYEQQQQSFNNNNNTSINSNYYSTSSTSRPSTSFGGKKWK